jgi:MFS family permease
MKKIYLAVLPIVLTTITVMMAVDLYLPAIPDLPGQLGGTAVEAQYTLASFLAAFAIGQLFFGLFADRVDRRWLLSMALVVLGASSLAAAAAENMGQLITLRFVQGLAAAGGIALVPVLVRELGDALTVIRLLGTINTIEALVPAFAPAVGTWLIKYTDWRASFLVVAGLTLVAVLVFQVLPPRRREPCEERDGSLLAGYRALLSSRRFLGYMLTHAFAIGGLDTFILAAPYVITAHAGGTIEEFAIMQMALVLCYVIAANAAGVAVKRIGADEVIAIGGMITIVGGVGLLASFVLMPQLSVYALAVSMVPVNIGIGLRGGACFMAAMDVVPEHAGAAGALVIFACLVVASIGTPAIAPYLPDAPWVLGVAVTLYLVAALAVMPLIRAERAADIPT